MSSYAKNESASKNNETVDINETVTIEENTQQQTINLFVTHGHCSTPFAGEVNDLKLEIPARDDLGNPLENMRLSFKIDPNTFNVCNSEELTAKIKTPYLFTGIHNEQIVFKSTNVYTMGLDWYQVNGTMSIRGIEKEVKFFVTGIRDSKETIPSSLVFNGQVNLFDWGIDYDEIVNGTSSNIATKWLHLNMKIENLTISN